MNRFEIKNAAEKIAGYFNPMPYEKDEVVFERARQEVIAAYKQYIKTFEQLSFEQFKSEVMKNPV